MPRKGPAPRRELTPDPVYRSVLVTQVVNKVLLRGKRSVAEKIVYDALRQIEEKTGSEPVATMTQRLANELMDAANGVGASVKRRDDLQKMAESNKAFAHYRY